MSKPTPEPKRFTCDGTYPRGYHYVVSDLTYAQVDQMLETLGRNSDADILFKQLTAFAGGKEWDERQMFCQLKQAWINKGYVKVKLLVKYEPSAFAIYHHDGRFHLIVIWKE